MTLSKETYKLVMTSQLHRLLIYLYYLNDRIKTEHVQKCKVSVSRES